MVADRHSFRIITTLTLGPASIRQLSRSLGIPRTLCYRRVKAMENQGLIFREPDRGTGGNPEITYGTIISSMKVFFTPATVSVAVWYRDGTGEGYILDPKDDRKPLRTMVAEELELFQGEAHMMQSRPQ